MAGNAQTKASPRLLASERAASDLLKRVSLLACGEKVAPPVSPPPAVTAPTHPSEQSALAAVDPLSTAPLLSTIDWSNPDVALRSLVNLLLPLPFEGVKVSRLSSELFVSCVFSCCARKIVLL